MKKKLIISLLLISLLTCSLTACSPPIENDTPPHIYEQNQDTVENVVYKGEPYYKDDLVYRGEEYEIQTLPYYPEEGEIGIQLL